MSQPTHEFIERYHREYLQNPRSRVFAPLTEAYRRSARLDEAHRIAQMGVSYHPDFAAGRVAFAKVLIDLKKFPEALEQLQSAVALSPDNLMAQQLLGEILLRLRRPKEALRAFKMVLFLYPDDERAQSIVKKWEFLTADEYDAALFDLDAEFYPDSGSGTGAGASHASDVSPLEQITSSFNLGTQTSSAVLNRDLPFNQNAAWERELERALSLADAFMIRNDLERAASILVGASKKLGHNAQLQSRMNMLAKRAQPFNDHLPNDSSLAPPPQARTISAPIQSPFPQSVNPRIERRKQTLQTLLRRIQARRLG